MPSILTPYRFVRGIGTTQGRKLRLFYSTLIQADPITPPRPSLIEESVKGHHEKYGITEFVHSPPKLLAGIINDPRHFQVHEIDTDGNRVQLTNIHNLPDYDFKNWEDSKFIHFTLYKEGLETTEAVISLVAELKHLNVRMTRNQVTYAGKNDKNAQTTQRMSMPNFALASKVLPTLSVKNIKIGNFNYAPEPVQLRNLKGNHFKILLPNLQVQLNQSLDQNFQSCSLTLDETMRKFREEGFINYYGLQRFGINDLQMGTTILQSNWNKVFDLLFSPLPGDSELIAKIKSMWFTDRNPKEIEKLIPAVFHNDPVLFLVQGLARYPNKSQKAFYTIPPTITNNYFEAFRSYVFNHVASYRVKTYGPQVIPGDVVMVKDPSEDRITIKILTEEHLDTGKYSIHDVILPVLGTKSTRYGHPRLQEFYNQLLAELKLDSSCFKKMNITGEFATGFYRPLYIKPTNVNHKMIPLYESNILKKFMPSDLDLLESHSESSQVRSVDDLPNLIETKDDLKDKIRAIVEFSLPQSTYATMALREIVQ